MGYTPSPGTLTLDQIHSGGTHSSPGKILLHLNSLKDQTISQKATRNCTSYKVSGLPTTSLLTVEYC